MPFTKLIFPLLLVVSCSSAGVPSEKTTTQTKTSTSKEVTQVTLQPTVPTTTSQTLAKNSKLQDKIEAKKFFELTPALNKYCNQLGEKFESYKWGNPNCSDFDWKHVRNSDLGTPLIWTVFGDENDPKAMENTTLVLCGVHGDEITPVKFCWDLMDQLRGTGPLKDKVVVIAPLVAPDSFIKEKPTRTNGRGVDINRNFPTADWNRDAHKKWKLALKGDKRKFPGPKAASEQETIFQMNLILRYKPNKVISIHAPLTLLDYDGPSIKGEVGKSAQSLLDQMSSKASGYKVSNYPIFPGSLGNWAGKEKHIPTYTVELPNSNPFETDKFWNLFKDALLYAVDHKMKPPVD